MFQRRSVSGLANLTSRRGAVAYREVFTAVAKVLAGWHVWAKCGHLELRQIAMLCELHGCGECRFCRSVHRPSHSGLGTSCASGFARCRLHGCSRLEFAGSKIPRCTPDAQNCSRQFCELGQSEQSSGKQQLNKKGRPCGQPFLFNMVGPPRLELGTCRL